MSFHKSNVINVKDINENKKNGASNTLFQSIFCFLFLTLAQYGMVSALSETFFLLPPGIVCVFFAAGISLIIVISIYALKLRKLLLLYFLPVIFYIGYMMTDRSVNGCSILVSVIADQYQTYYQLPEINLFRDIVLATTDQVIQDETFFILLSFIILLFPITMLLGVAVKKGRSLLLGSVCIIPIVLCLGCGLMISLFWTLFLLCVFFASLQYVRDIRFFGTFHKSTVFGSICILTGTIFCTGISNKVTYPYVKKYLLPIQNVLYESKTNNVIEDVKTVFGSYAGGGISGGDLSTTGNLKPTNRVVLYLNSDTSLNYPLYLRGFVGTTYNGKRWRGVGFSSDAFSFYDITTKKYMTPEYETINLYSSFVSSYEKIVLSIDYRKNEKNHLMPYLSKETDNENEYSCFIPLNYQEVNYISLDYSQYFENFANAQEISYWKDQYDLMKSKAYSEYLLVPDTVKKLRKDPVLNGFVRYSNVHNSMTDIIRKITVVQNFLENQVYYTLQPGKMEGEDFVDTFLYEKKKGYCMHYATAATILFRLLDVPARYVEGYVVPAQNTAKYDADTKRFTYKVTEKQAHAWVEIWIDGYGWKPVEVTPGYNGFIDMEEQKPSKEETKEETTVTTTTNKETQQESTKEHKDPNENSTNVPAEETTGDAFNPGNTKISLSKLIFVLCYVAIGVIIIVTLFAVFLGLPCYFGYRKRHKKMTLANRKEAVWAIYDEMCKLSQANGISFTYEISKERLHAAYFKDQAEDYSEDYLKRLLRALFGPDQVTEEEYLSILKGYRLMRSNILRTSSVGKRIKLVWFKHL